MTEILRRIWLFYGNKLKSSVSFSKQPTQLIIAAHNCDTELYQVQITLSTFLDTSWISADSATGV